MSSWLQCDPLPRRFGSSSRRRRAAVMVGLMLIVLLTAMAVTLWNTTLRPRMYATVCSVSQEAGGDGAGEMNAPSAAHAVEQLIVRWATRNSAEDESWREDLAGQIAPDAAQRIASMSCLPVQRAPLSVGVYISSGESQQGAIYYVSLTLEVRDASGGQTPVDVDAQADWDAATGTWVLTAFDCHARAAN